MRFCGHTMGTPDLDIFQAMRLFAELGYDGIEVRVAANGQLSAETYSPELGRKVRERARELGIEIACLTPYFRDFVTAKRESELAGMRKAIDMAADLGCGLVRAYGGILPPPGKTPEETWAATVSGIRESGDYAAGKSVRIAIETHVGSLTLTAGDTARMVRDVGMPNVGILFDFAWVHYANRESAAEAVAAVAPHLLHCHVKDWTYEGGDREKRRSCLMGEGEVPWRDVLPALRSAGFRGYICDEYERFWHPDQLPRAEVGMKRNLAYVRKLAAAAGG